VIDIAIVGGGISGLWILNRLRSLGYDAHLFERTALGSGQTIACQGIIHSGAKYGDTNPIPALAEMPARWRKCIAGLGEVDLRGVTILGEQMLFKGGEIVPLAGEPVLDVKSLIRTLCRPVQDYIYLGAPPTSRLTIYTAGLGNEIYSKETQRRPLRMFMVRPNPFGSPVFVHWTGKQGKPGMTLTTHGDVLYLGGNVAEMAVGMNEEQSYLWALTEIQYRFPNFRWEKMRWDFHDVIRAEGANGGELPNGPVFKEEGPKAVCWPTKLALTPVLADKAVEWVRNGRIEPRSAPPPEPPRPPDRPLPLGRPPKSSPYSPKNGRLWITQTRGEVLS